MTIVSFKHSFIFIKTRKTAGTSVEAFLRNICGEKDIVTPVSPDDDYPLVMKGLYPRNYSNDKEGERVYVSLIREGRFEEAQAQLKRMKRPFRNHMPLPVVRKKLRKPLFFMRAHKVTVERHPFGFVLSRAAFDKRKENPADNAPFSQEELAQAVRNLCARARLSPELLPRNWDMYARGDKVLVHRIMRYESLAEDLKKLTDDLGVEIDVDLPHMKSVGAGAEKNFSLIDDDCKQIIREHFKETFRVLNYDANA